MTPVDSKRSGRFRAVANMQNDVQGDSVWKRDGSFLGWKKTSISIRRVRSPDARRHFSIDRCQFPPRIFCVLKGFPGFLGISKNFLGISKKFLGISKNFLGNSKNFLGISKNFRGFS